MSESTPTYAVRLGLTDSDTNYWKGLLTQWNELYPQYKDKIYSRTEDIRNQLLNLINDAVDFD
ncbi:MAG: hypothetical protein WCK78_00270 [Paludibacter sp.]